MIKVEWSPTWEPEENMAGNPGAKTLIDAWIAANHHQPPTRRVECPPDAHLSNLARQGFHASEADRWQTTMGDPIRQRVLFDMEPINPQLDIHPSTTGECKVEIRMVDIWDKDSPTHAKPTEMACIYRPNGRCVGTITPSRLVTLRQLYEQAASTGVHAQMIPVPSSFEEEMVDLIIRHKTTEHSKNQLSPWGVAQSIKDVMVSTPATVEIPLHMYGCPIYTAYIPVLLWKAENTSNNMASPYCTNGCMLQRSCTT